MTLAGQTVVEQGQIGESFMPLTLYASLCGGRGRRLTATHPGDASVLGVVYGRSGPGTVCSILGEGSSPCEPRWALADTSHPQLAQTFAPHSNVIGYELLNEPFIASKSTAGVPYNLYNRANTERKHLVPLYDRLAKAIRRHDPRTLLWWEPVTGGGGNAGEGFDRVPGIEDGGAEKSVMSFHSYGPNLADGDTMVQAVEKRVAQVAKIGGAAVVSVSLSCVKLELIQRDAAHRVRL